MTSVSCFLAIVACSCPRAGNVLLTKCALRQASVHHPGDLHQTLREVRKNDYNDAEAVAEVVQRRTVAAAQTHL